MYTQRNSVVDPDHYHENQDHFNVDPDNVVEDPDNVNS